MLLPLCWTGCRPSAAEGTVERQAVRVKTVSVKMVPVEGVRRYSGTVEARNGVALSFPVSGTIGSLQVEMGMRVRKGQLLATLDPTSMQSALEAARAAREQAEDAYARMKELHDRNSLPDMKWVEVQSKLRQARSMEELAAKNLRDCRLLAPFSGVIAEKTAEVGQNVLPGVPVARLVADGALDVKISVPEAEMATVSVGQQVMVSVPAAGGQSLAGRVTEKGAVAHPASRSYDVKVGLETGTAGVMPGMVAEVVLAQADSVAHCVVPARIVQLDEHNRTFVWVDNGGKAEKRNVRCGDYTARGVVVEAGLHAGDRLIVEGQQKVCSGTPVCN